MNVYNHIEDYLNGDLTGDERSIFEKALRVDPELELAVKRHQHTIAHLDALRLREKIREKDLADRLEPQQWRRCTGAPLGSLPSCRAGRRAGRCSG